MTSLTAYQEGLQDARNAVHYEKVVGESHRLPYPLTLECAERYSDSYGFIKSQEDIDAYNTAFSLIYVRNPRRRRRKRSHREKSIKMKMKDELTQLGFAPLRVQKSRETWIRSGYRRVVLLGDCGNIEKLRKLRRL